MAQWLSKLRASCGHGFKSEHLVQSCTIEIQSRVLEKRDGGRTFQERLGAGFES